MKTNLAHALLLLVGLAAAPALGSPGGELDPAFGDLGRILLRDAPFKEFLGVDVFVEPGDGKILVVADGSGSDRLLRFNGDGSLDQSFGNQGTVLLDFDGDLNVYDVEWLPGAKLLVAGALDVYGTPDNVIHGSALLARMLTDGSPDVSFGVGGQAMLELDGVFESVSEILPQPDGRIVVFGTTDRSGSTENILVRFTQDGLLDESFGNGPTPGVSVIDVSGIDARYAAAISQSNGQFLICGDTVSGAGVPYSVEILAVRIDPDGAPDPTFGNNGMILIDGRQDSIEINACLELADGHLVFVGKAGSGERQRAAAWRLTPDGRLDAGCGANGVRLLNTDTPSAARAMLLMADGWLAIAGAQLITNSTGSTVGADMLITRIDPTSGAVDLDFGDRGMTAVDFGAHDSTSNAAAASLKQQSDGKLVIVGSHVDVNDWYYSPSIAIARVDPYGAGSNGWASLTDDYVTVTATGGDVALLLRRTGGSTGQLTVDYATAADTAIAGVNYVATSGTVTWPDGDFGEKTISITVLGAQLATNFKYFKVALSNPNGGLARDQATIAIAGTPASGGGSGGGGSSGGGSSGGGGGAIGVDLLLLSLLARRRSRLLSTTGSWLRGWMSLQAGIFCLQSQVDGRA